MALFEQTRHKSASRLDLWQRVVPQALLVPEAGVLIGLLLIAWAFNFPPLIGVLAIVTALIFGVRLGLLAMTERQIEQGAYDRADRLVRTALRLNPWSIDALVLRAQGLSHRGQDEAAEQVLRRAATIAPRSPALQSALASSILAQGRIAEGWEIAYGDAEPAPDGPQAAQQQAWLALHVEDNPASARAIILRAEPQCLPPRLGLPLRITLAEALMAMGAHAEAERTLQAVEADLNACPPSQQAELLFHLGRLHTTLGASGAAYYRRSVKLDPHGRYAQEAWRSAVNS